MIHAYDNCYVNNAQRRLSFVIDYLAFSIELPIKQIENILKTSTHLAWLMNGHPSYVAGKSGIEIAELVAEEFNLKVKNEYKYCLEKSVYYWAGYYLAFYSWYTCKSLAYIFYSVSLEKVLSMYRVYHEMDIMHFVEDFEPLVSHGFKETNLKLLRTINNLSQSELAKKANVSIRSIQLYEQRVNDINKAQVGSLAKIAKTLNRNIEDLLEN